MRMYMDCHGRNFNHFIQNFTDPSVGQRATLCIQKDSVRSRISFTQQLFSPIAYVCFESNFSKAAKWNIPLLVAFTLNEHRTDGEINIRQPYPLAFADTYPRCI